VVGRRFHTCAAATGKARSPSVRRRVIGTSSAVDDPERSLRRESTSAARLSLSNFTVVLPKMATKAPRTNHLRVSRHILPVHQLFRAYYSFLSSEEADCDMQIGIYRCPSLSAAFYRSPPRKWPEKQQKPFFFVFPH